MYTSDNFFADKKKKVIDYKFYNALSINADHARPLTIKVFAFESRFLAYPIRFPLDPSIQVKLAVSAT